MLWLYDEFETDFTYNGIVLNNAYDSDIHWVLNTMYKLTFKYPTVDNNLYSFIEKGMIVKADEHDRTNLFRIKDIDISENDKCVTVTAYQKNYDFSKRLVNNFGRLRVNCMSVLDEWYSNFLSSEKDFSYYSDINAINSFVSHNDDTDNKLRTSFELLGGIADTYSADIDMHDKQISLLERLGRDTEEVLTTAKNISEFVNTSNSDEIVTRIYASSTFKVGDKYDKKDLREQHRQQLKALRESQKEYSQGRNAVKKAQQMKEEIAKRYAKELAKNNKKVKRSGKVIKSYSQIESEVNAKYQARERKSQQRKAESQAIADRKKAEIESLKAQQKEELEALDEEITINLIVESPLINDYPFINEIAVSNNDLRTAEELEEWAMEYFTKQNIDKPKNSIKVTYEQLSEDINRGDTVILKYLKYGVDERIRVVETHYDPMLKKWKEFILGEKEGRLGSEVSNASSGAIAKANAYTDIITMDIERKVKERSENYDKLFKKNTDEINKKIEDGFEKAKASSEVTIAKIDEDLEKKLAPIRNQVSTTVENYNRQFQATNLEISKNRVEATKQIQALTDRVNNIQDISNNETVVELRGLVNGATSKVTELETSITREFTAVKKKNEDGLNAVKAEFTKGVDGLTSKITSLEEYKNQDGTRTESLKQWVQRDTANQLSRERTEINKIIDNKGFVKNTEFSNKFNENAQGINRQLSALETYKNQDGTRVANMQIWAQNNTANQLTAARRSIESWVNEKGYATTSVVENKVQETANSFSREISNVRNSIPTSVGGRNYILNSEKLTNINGYGTNWEKTVENGTLVFTKVRATDNAGVWAQIMPFLKDNFQNEVVTWSVDVKASKNISFNDVGQETNGKKGRVDLTTQWQRISHTFTNRFTQWFSFVFYQMVGTCSPGDKIYIRLPKLEKGNIATDWTPAPEDVEQNVNELNTWKQTATETLNTVSSGLNDSVKHSQLRIGADGIDFGSNKVFNGRNLASMLSVSPDSIKAITDRLVISPANENLVKNEFRNRYILGGRDVFLNKIYGGNELAGDYYFAVDITAFDAKELKAMIHVKYTDGTNEWFDNKFPSTDFFGRTQETTVKVPLKSNKTIEFIEPIIFQPRWSNFDSYILGNIKVYKKKSAELIVDGSIEGRQIKTQTLETGHHKAGSITSEIIAAKAVKVNNLLVDDAMIQEFVAHKAFISKLWAQDAFIKSLQAIKISATQLDTDWLSAYTGDIGGFRIGKNPNQPGDFWLTGSNNFNCGLNPGHNIGTRGAQIWAAWGNRWDKAGNNAWWVDGQGVMHCYNRPILSKGLDVSGGNINMHGSNIEGYADENRNKTTVIWWSQINRVKSSVSDKRFKTNIKPTKVKAVDLLNKIEIVEFNWKKDNKFEKIGAIAQQVQSVESSLVVHDMDDKQTYNDYLRINYYDTIPYLIKAVQELSQQNNELKNKLEELING
nr:MAG TPA: Neck appendage protein [Caudoviricetes sp.]